MKQKLFEGGLLNVMALAEVLLYVVSTPIRVLSWVSSLRGSARDTIVLLGAALVVGVVFLLWWVF